MRVSLPSNLIEEIYHVCHKTKMIDWFYEDYYKKKRKTIDLDDAEEIYYAALDLGLNMSEELYKWFNDL